MKKLYAKFVLWLILAALELHYQTKVDEDNQQPKFIIQFPRLDMADEAERENVTMH